MITWFKSLDGSTQWLLIVVSLCFIGIIWVLIDYMYGPYREEELERGSIIENGIIFGYYRIVKRYYGNGTTKIITERIKLP